MMDTVGGGESTWIIKSSSRDITSTCDIELLSSYIQTTTRCCLLQDNSLIGIHCDYECFYICCIDTSTPINRYILTGIECL